MCNPAVDVCVCYHTDYLTMATVIIGCLTLADGSSGSEFSVVHTILVGGALHTEGWKTF